ncbi:MAG TPA: helix-turn-helix domain-containing protein [Terriglobia bacterium]|nr:helix-turn-helix domain-containing protein [Terriglobia bacterium]
MNTAQFSTLSDQVPQPVEEANFEATVDVKTAARFLGVSPSLVYAYVERKQIPHFRMMGRSIRFSLSELERWRQQFFVNGGIDDKTT